MSQLGLGMSHDTTTPGQGRSRMAVLVAGAVVLVLLVSGLPALPLAVRRLQRLPGPG